MILDNPVWKKPFIAISGANFFFPFIGLIQSFGLDMIEQALKRHPDLERKYSDKARADFLENRTEEAVRKAFPKAKVFRGLKWLDDINGREGESDVLVLLDTHALVLECKSRQVRPRARRGDPPALKDELERLISDPSKQGKRFADYLLNNKGILELKDSKGVSHEVDVRKLLRATIVNVILEYLGYIGIQHQLLRRSAFIGEEVSPTATIPLHDLECILEILDSPPLAFHYLRRRAEIECANDIMSNEIGLLSMYLATSFDIGDFEGDKTRKFFAPTMQEELTPYFMGREIGTPVPKPKLRLRGWWADMLRKFEERGFLGWLEAAYTLLCVGYNRQGEFERLSKTIVKDVRSNWHRSHKDTCLLITGAPHSRTAVICVAVKNKTRDEIRDLAKRRMGMAQEEHGAQRTLVICLPANKRVYPYLAAYFSCPELEKLNLGDPAAGE